MVVVMILRAIIAAEFAAVIGVYALYHKTDSDQDFRFKLGNGNYSAILESESEYALTKLFACEKSATNLLLIHSFNVMFSK